MRLRIEELCKRFGLSMNELAERCGIGQPALSDYNCGKRNPTLGSMKTIASSIGISVHELIPDDDEIGRNVEWFLTFTPEERLRIAERDGTVNETLRHAKEVDES